MQSLRKIEEEEKIWVNFLVILGGVWYCKNRYVYDRSELSSAFIFFQVRIFVVLLCVCVCVCVFVYVCVCVCVCPSVRL